MTSQPDKLFREKLENFSTPVPAAAWGRIEAGLDQPGRSFWWVKIAASITLVGVAAFLLWPSATTQQTEIALLTKPIESTTPIVKDHTTTATENISVAEKPEQKAGLRADENDRARAGNAHVRFGEKPARQLYRHVLQHHRLVLRASPERRLPGGRRPDSRHRARRF